MSNQTKDHREAMRWCILVTVVTVLLSLAAGSIFLTIHTSNPVFLIPGNILLFKTFPTVAQYLFPKQKK